MPAPEIHLMQVELIAERRVVRYFCRTCLRCLEDGPDGLALLNAGDVTAVHRGGKLADLQADIETDPAAGNRRH